MNTIQRTYRRRGKSIQLVELTDLLAVRRDRHASRFPMAAAVEAKLPEHAISDARALQNQGWELIPNEGSATGSRVYLKPNGRVALGTNRLTVCMPPELNESEARGVLEERGLPVLERLRMAPNLFVVAVPDNTDPLQAAEDLTSSGQVEFAEPQLIEIIGHR